MAGKRVRRELGLRAILNPCRYAADRSEGQVFVYIQYTDEGHLNLSGVVCIKIVSDEYRGLRDFKSDVIRDGVPNVHWTPQMLRKLYDIWKRWNHNYLKPYCEHQKELGWDVLADEKLTLYHYRLAGKVMRERKQIEDDASRFVKDGKFFTPDENHARLLALPYLLDTYKPLSGEVSEYYQPDAGPWRPTKESREVMPRGFVSVDQCEEGLLYKPCPVCGYPYGKEFRQEEVPKEIVDWLFSLPQIQNRPKITEGNKYWVEGF